jgi:hypothetical protein
MTIVRRAVRTLGLLLGVPAPLAGQDIDSTPGPIIDTVIVVTQDIYSPEEEERSWVYRLTNGLHVTTRPSVVRYELLFRQGEPYDPLKVAETERNLRARGLFRDVEIDTLRLGDKLAVRVRTSDGWTTSLKISLNFSAGEATWGLGLEERNLLGSGARGGISYRQEPDRTAFRLSGGMDRIAGTRLGVNGFYDALSDGKFGVWNMGVPFRANTDPWGFELPGQAGRQRILQFRNGDSVETFRRRTAQQLAWVGAASSASPARYLRFGVAALVKREEYLLWELNEDTVSDSVQFALGVWLEFRDARFRVVTHYNGFAREVDVDLSTQVLVGAWLAPDDFGYRANGLGPALMARAGGAAGPVFGWVDVAASGLLTSSGGLDSGTVLATGTLVGQFIRKNATVLHMEVGARKGTPPGMEFDLGLGLGPRAFPAHAFTGDVMVWGTLEHRAFLIDEVLGFMGLGFAAFVDYGGAWYSRDDPLLDQDPRLGGNIGFGLRFGSTRGTGANVGRVDLAYRFGEGCRSASEIPPGESSCQGNRWAISFGRAFPF